MSGTGLRGKKPHLQMRKTEAQNSSNLFKVAQLGRDGAGVQTQVGPQRSFIIWGSLL